MTTSFLWPVLSSPVGARIAFYPSLIYGWLVHGKQRRWYDHIDSGLILGGLPLHGVAKQLLMVEKVKAVLSINEDYENRFITPTENEWREMGISRMQIPTVDYNNAPSVDQIVVAVNFIIEHRKLMHAVYVHCKAGRSRSATVVICYLMKTKSLTMDAAVKLVKSRRPHIILGSAHIARISEFYDHACIGD